jgi:hypothetical protein
MSFDNQLLTLSLLDSADLIAIITKLSMQLREKGSKDPILYLLSKEDLINIINTLAGRLAIGKGEPS